MKAKVCSRVHTEMDPLKSTADRICKPKVDDNEMAACFARLKQIVPTVQTEQKLSKVQLLQHVIDYIMDLEIALNYPPSLYRKPLCEANYLNTMARHLESMNLTESRPIS